MITQRQKKDDIINVLEWGWIDSYVYEPEIIESRCGSGGKIFMGHATLTISFKAYYECDKLTEDQHDELYAAVALFEEECCIKDKGCSVAAGDYVMRFHVWRRKNGVNIPDYKPRNILSCSGMITHGVGCTEYGLRFK